MIRKGFILLTIVFGASAGQAESAQENWRAEMQKMKTAMTSLLNYAADVDSFNSPANALAIDELVTRLKDGSKVLKSHQGEFDGTKDPTVKFVAEAFEDNFSAIQRATSKGRRDFARFLILNATAYCMECHTRNQGGNHFVGLSSEPAVAKLDPVEKVEYMISVREFKPALAVIEEYLKKDQELAVFGNEKLLRYGLSVTIKYFQDLGEALRLVDLALKSKGFPYFARPDVNTWREALNNLKKEKAPTTLDNKIEKSEAWIKKAQALNAKNQSSHAGDPYLLQANATLLALFKDTLDGAKKSKVLFLVGETYRLLPEHMAVSLHESYYEACIRNTPRSAQALQCYEALEGSVLMGYTGSSGTHLPMDVSDHLKELKKLSKELK